MQYTLKLESQTCVSRGQGPTGVQFGIFHDLHVMWWNSVCCLQCRLQVVLSFKCLRLQPVWEWPSQFSIYDPTDIPIHHRVKVLEGTGMYVQPLKIHRTLWKLPGFEKLYLTHCSLLQHPLSKFIPSYKVLFLFQDTFYWIGLFV